ncbi:MAG: DUF3124 domain-containing protein [Pseudomonadota bacterium]
MIRGCGLLAGLVLALAACEESSEPDWVAPGNYANQFTVREQPIAAKQGQKLYVPIYSNILAGEGARPTEMAATLAIRNTDIDHDIFITSVKYYNTTGDLIETYLDGLYGLAPMASAFILINVSDTRGGIGANFIVDWQTEEPVSDPVVEAIMVGASGTKGFSFTSHARVIDSIGN